MKQKNRTLKRQARKLLLPAWNRHILVSFIVFAVSLVSSSITGLFEGAAVNTSADAEGISRLAPVFSFLSSAIMELIIGLVMAGALLYFLKLVRNETPSAKDVFSVFRMQPDRFLIVGIIELAAGAVCFGPAYIVNDVTGRASTVAINGADSPAAAAEVIAPPSPAVIAAIIALLIAGGIVYVWIRLSLILSDFILLDNPEMGAIAAMAESLHLMKNRKKELFLLLLSMAGYFVIAACTMFIGLLWVMPYVMTSLAYFYESVLSERNRE